MKRASVASMMSEPALPAVLQNPDDVVEIGILLPANRAADLIQIARSRRESVGQLLRGMIDRELAAQRRTG